MLWNIRRLSAIGLLACVTGTAACRDAPSPDAAADEPATAQGNGMLAGEWRWVKSVRDGKVIQPESAADSTTIVLGALGSYVERTQGTVLESRYAFGRGQLYQLRDTSFTVLLLDSSRFFPRSNGAPPSVAVRSLDGDTLVFSGTGTDASVHTFVHVGHTR